VSVCQKSVFYGNGWTDRARLFASASFGQSYVRTVRSCFVLLCSTSCFITLSSYLVGKWHKEAFSRERRRSTGTYTYCVLRKFSYLQNKGILPSGTLFQTPALWNVASAYRSPKGVSTWERRTLDSVTKWAVIGQRYVASTLVVVVCRILLNEGLKHWVRMCNINCTSRNSVDKWINFIRNLIKRNSFVPVSVEVVGRHRVAGVNSYRLRPVRGRWPIWHELFLAAVQRLAADELIGHVTVLSADDRHTGLQGLRRVTTPIQHKGKMSVLSSSLCSFADEIWITEAFISPRSKQSRPSRCLYHISVIVIDIFGVILPYFSLFVTGYWYFNGLGITWLCRFSD